MKEFFIKIVSRGTTYLIFASVVSECEESLQRLSVDKHTSLFLIVVSNKEFFFIKIVSRGTTSLIFASVVSECEESLLRLLDGKHSSLVFITV